MEKFQDIISKVENLTVAELAELVKAMEEKFGVSAAVPVAQQGGAGAGDAGEEKSSFDVILQLAVDRQRDLRSGPHRASSNFAIGENGTPARAVAAVASKTQGLFSLG